ncbi:MAG: BspA family leucine-rich repeat surface protein [Bacteroidota bacterium]
MFYLLSPDLFIGTKHLLIVTLLSILSIITGTNSYAQDLTSNLTVQIGFDGDVSDGTGNGHNGTLTTDGGTSYITDRFGNANSALNIDGGDYITIPDFTWDRQNFTISIWSQATNTGTSMMVISKHNSSTDAEIFIQANADGNYEAIKNINNTGYWLSAGTFYGWRTINFNSWDLNTITYDGTDLNWYLNGELVRQYSGISGNLYDNSFPIRIGTTASAPSISQFMGAIDDMRLYDRALTGTEVLALFEEGGYSRPFITTWQATASETITIPTTGTGYNYTVNWGDGNIESGFTGDASHTYNNAGTYTVSITGDFPRIYFNEGNEGQDKDKILTIEQWGSIAWTSMQSAFEGCTQLHINASDAPDLSNVTNVQGMFRLCTAFNENIDHWDMSTITDLSFMFDAALSFNQPLSSWDVSSVTNMYAALRGTSFNQDISNWDVSSVQIFSYLFADVVTYNQPMGSWNMSNATSLSGMFVGATAFNQDISNWDVSGVESIVALFQDASSFNQDISNWDVSNVSFTYDNGAWRGPFDNASSFDQSLAAWDISSMTDMTNFFTGSGLSAANYDATLEGWARLDPGETQIPTSLTLGATGLEFCEGADARQRLIDDYGWTISGDDYACDGLVAYYPFAGNAMDSTNNNNDGTVNGAVLTNDRFGNANSAYFFDGVDDYIINTSPAGLDNQDHTVAAWVQSKKAGFQGIAGLIGGAGNNGYYLNINSTGHYSILEGNGTSWGYAVGDDVYQNDNQWHFVVGTRTGGVAKIYIDGVLQVGTTTETMSCASCELVIGYSTSATQYFGGSLDDIRIYSRALSDSEIQDLYTEGGYSPPVDIIVSDVDGNNYSGVVIGTQVWMDENLTTTKFNDGTDIIEETVDATWMSLTSPALCWMYNDQATYGPTYGALYNWYVVETDNICPSGWHVPSDAEWTTLIDYAGGEANAGNILKEEGTTHWISATGATDEFGFTALPGGDRKDAGAFANIRYGGYWWSATEADASTAWNRRMTYTITGVTRESPAKWWGKSIRCIRDATTQTATNIKSFSLPNADQAIIDTVNHTVTIPGFSGHTSLAPTITLSDGATISPASGVAQDFTNTFIYTVTAEDRTTTQVWTVYTTLAEFISESHDLNDNQVPEGWTLQDVTDPADNGSVEIANGRLNGYITDGIGYLWKKGQVPEGTQKVVFEWDGYLDYSAWGMTTPLYIHNDQGNYMAFSAKTYDNTLAADEIIAEIFSNSTGLFVNDLSTFTIGQSYHFKVVADSSGYTYSGYRSSDGGLQFSIQTSSPDFFFYDMETIWFRVYSTTDNNTWMDNPSVIFVKDTDLVAYYPFNGDAFDESGNGNNGTENGGVSLTSDRFGNANSAFIFDGVDDYISGPATNFPTGSSSRTMAGWIRANQNGLPGMIMEYGSSNYDGARFGTGYNSDNSAMLWGHNQDISFSEQDSSWHFVVTTYDGTAGSLYVDGQLLTSGNLTLDTEYDTEFGIGANVEGGWYTNGSIDDIRLYSRVLDSTEIVQLYTENGWGIPILHSTQPNAAISGNQIRLYGKHFTEPNTTISFGGTIVMPDSALHNVAYVTVPNMAYGLVDLTVTNDYGASDPIDFTVIQEGHGGYFTYHEVGTNLHGYSVDVIDLDKDGDLDFIAGAGVDNKVMWFENDGNQQYTEHEITTTIDFVTYVMAADIDSDGDIDVVVGANAGVFILSNNGYNAFTTSEISSASVTNVRSMDLGDVDGDGNIDIVVGDDGNDYITLYKNISGSFSEEIIASPTVTDWTMGIDIFDVDADGDMDVVYSSMWYDKFGFLENDGNESFTEQNVATTIDANHVIAFDLDQDGDTDYLNSVYADGQVMWYENVSGSYSQHLVSATTSGAEEIKVADINGDGNWDIVSSNRFGSNQIRYFLNDGSQNFSEILLPDSLDGTLSIYPADVDRDGDIDIVAITATNKRLVWFENQSISEFGFVTTWQTNSSSESITIPTFTGETYDYAVDWGDGTIEFGFTGDATHTYATAGIYTVSITGTFPRIYFNNGLLSQDTAKIQTVEQWGDITWTSMEEAFAGCVNLTLPATDAPDLSGTDNLYRMFKGCASINEPMDHWDVSNIVIIGAMFEGATAFNQPLNSWNTGNCANMLAMFNGASSFNQDLSNWTTSNALTMAGMFAGTPFNGDISSWDVANVSDFSNMLAGASQFDQDLSAWDISAATDIGGMLDGTNFSIANYDSTLIGWATLDAGEAQIPTGLTLGANGLTYCIGDASRTTLINSYGWTFSGDTYDCFVNAFITTWQTTTDNESITIPTFTGETYDYRVDWGDGTVEFGFTGDASHTYATAGTYTVAISGTFPRIFFNSGLESQMTDKIRSVEQWGSISWSSMDNAFSGCSNLTIPATDAPNLSLTTSLFKMLSACTSLNDNIEHWDVSTITEFSGLFDGATSFNQPLNNWDVSSAVGMGQMFQGASSFNQPLNNWVTSSLTNFPFIFYGASTFDQPLDNWDVSQVMNMDGAFQGSAFNQDIGGWDVGSATIMAGMFAFLSDFDQDLSGWNIGNVTTMNSMLNGTNLSTANYDATLQGWATLDAGETQIPTGLTLGAVGLTYCMGEAARNTLLNTYGWTIDGDTYDCFVNAFITTWQTTTDNESITIPTFSGETYDYRVDWGDGTVEFGFTGDATHTYATAGTYSVSISGTFPRVYFNNSGNKDKIISIDQWGDIAWSSMMDAFAGCANLTYNATDAPNLSGVSSLQSMFLEASSFNGIIGNWDVSNVSNFAYMFFDASSFNQDLSSWQTTSATSFDRTFRGASSFNQNINTWDVSNVITTDEMFYLASSFNQDLSSWETSNVTTMSGMFNYSAFNQDISGWDVSKVTDMNCMFCNNVAFDQNLATWDISSLTTLGATFDDSGMSQVNYDSTLIGWARLDAGEAKIPTGLTLGANGLTYCIGDASRTTLINSYGWTFSGDTYDCFANPFITTWQTTTDNESITIPTYTGETYDYRVDWGDGTVEFGFTGDASHTYATAGTFTVSISGTFPRIYFNNGNEGQMKDKILTIEQWGEIQWSSMEQAFSGCSQLHINASDAPDLSNVISLQAMFSLCISLNESIDHWNVSTITNLSFMFDAASSFNQPLSSWDVASVTDMYATLRGTAFNQDISNWNVSNVQYFSYMFAYATAYNQPLGSWDLSSAIRLSGMFVGASTFNQDISNWDVSGVESIVALFQDASSFNQDISNWDVSNVSFTYDNGAWRGPFDNASSFDQSLAAWDISSMTDMTNFFTGSGLSIANYDSTLIGWARLDAGETQIPTSITLGANGLAYCAGGAARNDLINTYSWTISGDTYDCFANAFITTWQTPAANDVVTIPTFTGETYDYQVDWGDGTIEFGYTGDASHTYASAGTYTVSISGIFPRIYFNQGSEGQHRDKIQTIEQWGMIQWSSMESAFNGCSNLTINASDAPDLSLVANLNSMFRNCTSFNGNIEHWDVKTITDFNNMFEGATSFNQPLNNWDVSGAIYMGFMFSGASSFDQPLNEWIISNVTYFPWIFGGATSFNQPLDGWDVSQVINMDGVFEGSAFNQNLSSWDISSAVSMDRMFNGSNLSVTNYDATLQGWVTLDVSETQIPADVTLGASGLTYCNSETERNTLINTYGWTISGDSKCIPDSSPPVITNKTATSVDQGSAVSIVVSLVDDESGIASANVLYRSISSGDSFTSSPLEAPSSGNDYTFSIPASFVDDIGLEYKFEVTNGADLSNTPVLASISVNSSSSGLNIPVSSFGSAESNYQIIAVPLSLPNNTVADIFDELMPYDDTKWRMYHYQNGSNQELSGSSTINPGLGYWLIVKESALLTSGQGTTVAATTDEPFTISLQQGWNQVGNPYEFNLSWADVQAANPGLPGLRKWDNTMVDGTILEAMEGGFVNVTAATTLKFPVIKNNSVNGRLAEGIHTQNPLNEPNWEVYLNLDQGKLKNRISGIGMNSQSNDGYDPLDGLNMPHFFDAYLEVNHMKEANGNFLSKDIIPTSENHVWEFSITSSSDEPLTFSWDNSYFGDNDRQLYLWDVDRQVSVDMRSSDSYSFSKSESKSFQVLFGSAEFILEKIDVSDFIVHNIWPNPIEKEMNIAFTLPSTDGVQEVAMEMVDMMGRKVWSYTNKFNPGYHELSWIRESIPSGIYIISMKVTGTAKQTRLILK